MIVLTLLQPDLISKCKIGDHLTLSGMIYTGRDAVLRRIVGLIKSNVLQNTTINLQGGVIFHTAVSPAGVGPTSSNKYEIESTIPALSKAGVKMHIGKGKLSPETVKALHEHGSIYAVLPPVTALLESKITDRRVIAFPELGMEALHQLRVEDFPCIVAAAGGRSIFD